MKYILDMQENGGDAKSFMLKLYEELNSISVSGQSVSRLHVAMILTEQIINSLQEVKEEKSEEGG